MFTSTTTALTGGATFTGQSRVASRDDSIVGTVFADQAGTLFVEQSNDGTNWDVSSSYAVAANDGKGFSEALVAAFWRLRYTNGGSAQATFRLSARSTAAGDS